MRAPRVRLSFVALLALGLILLLVGHHPRAGEPAKGEVRPAAPGLPPVFAKEHPESVDDLRAIQTHVQSLLAKLTPAVVGVRIGPSQGSGVIVTRDGYVLTAGHVSREPGKDAVIILPNGKQLKAKTLGRNSGIDSGMLKINGDGDYPFVEMGASEALKRGSWVIAIGHPGGFRPNRTPVLRVGRVLSNHKFFIRTDCPLVGGDSGGPLFGMSGKVVGIHSRIGGSITENIHVPVDTYRQSWNRLARGDSWGGQLGQAALVHSPGGKVIYDKEARLIAQDAKDTKKTQSHAHLHTVKMLPGFAYTIDMVSPNGKTLDPYLRLEDANGKELADDDDGGGNLNARIVSWPHQAENFRIIATTFDGGQTGNYKLIVRQAEPKLVSGTIDVLAALRLPKVAPIFLDRLQKSGNPLYASGTLVDATGKPMPNKVVAARWHKGQSNLTGDERGALFLQLSKQNIRDLRLEIPVGLKLALELTDSSGNPFQLKLDPAFDQEKVKSAGGKLFFDHRGELTAKDPGDRIRDDMKKRKIAKACVHKVHTVKMSAGSTYTIDLTSEDFDAYLRLEDASGKQLGEDDDSAGTLNARIVFTPEADADYRAIVTTCDPDQAGSYRLAILQKLTSEANPSR